MIMRKAMVFVSLLVAKHFIMMTGYHFFFKGTISGLNTSPAGQNEINYFLAFGPCQLETNRLYHIYLNKTWNKETDNEVASCGHGK